MKKKKGIEDTCFPVPQNFAFTAPSPVGIDTNQKLKKSLFQQTIRTAYQVEIPCNFTSQYNRQRPHKLVTDEQIETVVSLFQALQPQDAVEAALAQQFIITHIQAVSSARKHFTERDIKKFELTHQILETLQKYRSKGAQLISVQYNVNQGQIFNKPEINIKTSQKEPEPVTIEG